TALLTVPSELFATTTKKVVIVGGGIGGSTIARYLRKFIPQTTLLDITIIEPKTTYTTPFGTNEIITGSRTLEELTVSYDTLKSEIAGTIVHKKASSINSTAKYVSTEDGTQYLYDFCIVATGIDFEYSDIVGLSAETNAKVPHAYDLVNDGSTEQMTELKSQLDSMANGSKVVLVAPQNAYRCPPAPYERASQVAQYIKENKPNSTITILDPKGAFAKQDSFEKAWSELYGYGTDSAIISWEGGTVVNEIVIPNSGAKTIKTETDEISADVVTYIPTMKASKFAYEAGLIETDSTVFDLDKRWAPVNQETFESTMAGKEGIYIIGDSSKTNLPKSGYAANSEAKACAMAIVSKIKGINPIPETIMTNGCYSFVGKDYAISILQKFKIKEDKSGYALVSQGRNSSPLEADARWRKKEVEQGHAWYANFRKDCFGV
ncbi:MAG: Sulfide dehydrogenase [flavocytochrome C] flavoprotein chain precursor (EC, partial [uncultured Sulfurovum sp.]